MFNGSRVNQTEAASILRLITHLVDTFQLKTTEIGVITPYKAQAAYLKQILPETVLASTVDSFQGNERGVIILSLTRARSLSSTDS